MSLNEYTVEAAALEWFGELGYAVGHGADFAALRPAKPQLAPGEPAAERDSFGELVLVGRLREAIRPLNPAMPRSRTLGNLRDPVTAGLPKLLSGGLSVVSATTGTS